MTPIESKRKSLHKVLVELQLTHAKASTKTYKHHIYSGNEVLFTGNAHEVWEWLRTSGRVE